MHSLSERQNGVGTVADPSPLLHDTICDLRKRLADKDAVIDDLRRRLDAAEARLDAEAEERRKLTAVLTDQRGRRAPWWRRRSE